VSNIVDSFEGSRLLIGVKNSKAIYVNL
jgi:hypothetical protein